MMFITLIATKTTLSAQTQAALLFESATQQLENVDWSTMFGGQGVEGFEGCAAGMSNDVYVVGSQNTSYVIQNSGEQIGSASFFNDAYLVKFDENCVASFISYYGGSSGVDKFNEIELLSTTNQLHVAGKTSSPDLALINEVAMEDETLGGIVDGLYVKFDGNGFLLFHTYVGGDSYDELVDIKVMRTSGQVEETLIYYIGITESGDGWPAFENNPQSSSMNYSGGKDGFYIKRMGDLESQVHRTFFGSAANDVFIAVDLFKGMPVILGKTNATTYSSTVNNLPTDGFFPKTDNDYWDSEFIDNNGTADGNYFITHFGDPNPNPNFIDTFKWCTYIAPSSTILDILGHNTENLGDIVVSQHDILPNTAANIYVTGSTPIPINSSDIEFHFEVNGWHQGIAGGGANDAFIMQWRMENSLSLQLNGTLFGGNGPDIGHALTLDNDNNLFVCGRSTVNAITEPSEWCDTPQQGDFPICDQNGMLYTETEIANTAPRAFIAAFRPSGEMLWSTPYGMGDNNSARDICTNGNKVWIVGSSNKDWTFEDFDDNSDEDYFREILDPDDPALPEATIARFDIPQIVGIQETTLPSNNNTTAIFIFPNPSDGRMTIDLKNSGISGQFELKVINSLGQIAKAEQHTITKGSLEYNLSDLSPGVYRIVFLANGITHSASFVKN